MHICQCLKPVWKGGQVFAFGSSCNTLKMESNWRMCICSWVPLPGSHPPWFWEGSTQETCFPKQGKHHVTWAVSPAPGVFMVAFFFFFFDRHKNMFGRPDWIWTKIKMSSWIWGGVQGTRTGDGRRHFGTSCETFGPCPGLFLPVPHTEAFLVSVALLIHALFIVFVYELQPLIRGYLMYLTEPKAKWYP